MAETLKIRIREARPDDLPAIVGLLADDPLGRQREKPDEPLDPRYLSAFEALSADPNQELVVLVYDKAVVATMQLSFLPGLSRLGSLRCQVEAVRVARERRGGGIGRMMIEHAVEVARRRGCRLVQLTSDKSRADAQTFYRGLGFEPTHVGFKLELCPDAP